MTNTLKKPKYNSINERIKYQYRKHILRIGRKDIKTVAEALKHIRLFETYVDFKSFDVFNENLASNYVENLFRENKSLSFITSNLKSLRDFLNWLERQRGYRSKIDYNHIEYLNISRNHQREAKSQNYQITYKFDEIVKAIRLMPDTTEIERRNKALVSLQCLCTLRISELRTVKIRNLIEEDGIWFVDVNPKNMKVKFAKQRQVVLLQIAQDVQNNIIEWRDCLLSKDFTIEDPLFPIFDNRFNQKNLLELNLKPKEIRSDTTIRNIFKKVFENAGLEYINPHSFRKTLAKFAQTKSPAFLNAVRQNLGHSSIDTTLSRYGQLSLYDQRKHIAELKHDI